ncbi:MAG: exodeoxyribonuclease VII large subunit [Maricaulis sp.]|jgi:exodeoxyribonuclease VII large subunit|nr:exodeoxyribonuclease VII large subunit [Maricaulis sp.]
MADAASNAHEFSVSELAQSLKRTVEETFGHVRVRGELGRVTIAKSGHMYLDLKDEKAVIDGVMWKGAVNALSFRPEEGLEVIAEGRLSTYPGRSKYQIIIERLEPAGTGALMALLEERKKKLAAEGLFAAERKRALPFLPQVIGVVTSPTGAVIRDILHRLEDRFPRHVLLWPVVVQGDSAAGQIAAAIEGFNALPEGGEIPRPDVLIVARGGGSIEDLWAFNEEIVVRAAAASAIPLISAVGHETDTTLIDYASDRRAPTPTGAAEMAVPVRSDLVSHVRSWEDRLTRGLLRLVDHRKTALRSAGRALPRPENLLALSRQRFDNGSDRLPVSLSRLIDRRKDRLSVAAAGLRSPQQLISLARQRLGTGAGRLAPALSIMVRSRRDRLNSVAGGLRPAALQRELVRERRSLDQLVNRLANCGQTRSRERGKDLAALSARLGSVNFKSVLGRGFALVRDDQGALVRSGSNLKSGQSVSIEFADTRRNAVIDGGGPAPKRTPRRSPDIKPGSAKQGSLF